MQHIWKSFEILRELRVFRNFPSFNKELIWYEKACKMVFDLQIIKVPW